MAVFPQRSQSGMDYGIPSRNSQNPALSVSLVGRFSRVDISISHSGLVL